MSRYAASTKVSTSSSRDEIEKTLARYGADQFLYGWQEEAAVIGFRMKGRQIKFVLSMPRRDHRDFTHSSRGERPPHVAAEAWEQACRQKWRALALVIKAKLEAIESGIALFEDEFMANIVLPDGQSVGSFMRPQIADAYATGAMPRMLPQLPAPKDTK